VSIRDAALDRRARRWLLSAAAVALSCCPAFLVALLCSPSISILIQRIKTERLLASGVLLSQQERVLQ